MLEDPDAEGLVGRLVRLRLNERDEALGALRSGDDDADLGDALDVRNPVFDSVQFDPDAGDLHLPVATTDEPDLAGLVDPPVVPAPEEGTGRLARELDKSLGREISV
jgi:hypothetical protein